MSRKVRTFNINNTQDDVLDDGREEIDVTRNQFDINRPTTFAWRDIHDKTLRIHVSESEFGTTVIGIDQDEKMYVMVSEVKLESR